MSLMFQFFTGLTHSSRMCVNLMLFFLSFFFLKDVFVCTAKIEIYIILISPLLLAHSLFGLL